MPDDPKSAPIPQNIPIIKMAQDSPTPPRPPLFGLSEAVLLAFATGIVYLAAGAYEIGYQEYFGFTYLNIGVEDLTSIFRFFVVPLTIAVVLLLILALLFRFLAKFLHIDVSVVSIAFILFPIAVMLALMIF